MQIATSLTDASAGSRGRWLALGAYFVVLLVLNVFVVPYPVDNDLDEIGWIAAHQTLSRPESLANQNYPFGFPLLLRILTPLVGSLLTAAMLCSTVGATACVALVYALTRRLQSDVATAMAAAATAALMLLPLATSEFADNLTTALLLAGLLAVVTHPASVRAAALFGALTGLAFLMRFHFLLVAAIGSASLLVAGGLRRSSVARIGGFLGGFVLGALPLLVINTIVRGQPVHTGLTPYMIGFFATSSIDWYDFLGTYDAWPLSRLVRERPGDLVRLLYHHAQHILAQPGFAAAVVLLPLSLAWAIPAEARRRGMFLASVALLYLGLIVWPSSYSVRAVAPVLCLVCVLSFPALARLRDVLPVVPRLGRVRLVGAAWMAAAVVVLFIGIGNPFRPVLDKYRKLSWNRQLLAAMRAEGWRVDARVFSNYWDVYNLDDPRFITFHNYGGYMLLDPLFRSTLPRPEATTAAEWQAFLDTHAIQFVVAEPRADIQDFLDRRDPATWPEIYRDDTVVVLKRGRS